MPHLGLLSVCHSGNSRKYRTVTHVLWFAVKSPTTRPTVQCQIGKVCTGVQQQCRSVGGKNWFLQLKPGLRKVKKFHVS